MYLTSGVVMGQYTIQVAAKLSGVGIHTLRAWEKRYKTVTPTRSDTSRRLYSDQDIEKLKLLNALCTLGHSIGTIAQNSIEELSQLLKKMGGEQAVNGTVTTSGQDDKNRGAAGKVDVHASLSGLLLGLENFKLDIISHEIEKLKLVLSPKAFVFEVLLPLVTEVGRMVAMGKADIAHEHAISAILRFHIGHVLFQNLQIKRKKSQIVALATPEGDYHEFGIMAVALLCGHHGIKFYYLGPNLPASSLLDASKAVNADVVVLGTSDVSSVFKNGQLDGYLENLVSGLGKNQQLYVGGDGVFSISKFKRSRKFNFISSLKMMDEVLKELV
jgi:DNA-binding transcriptional MerR regulator